MNITGENQSLQGWAVVRLSVGTDLPGLRGCLWQENPRLVKVLSGQAGYTGDASNPAPVCAWHLQVLADKTVTRKARPSMHTRLRPILGGTNTTELASDIPDEATLVQNHVGCLKGTGIPLVSYERRQDSYAATSCTAGRHRSGDDQLVVTYFGSMMSAGTVGSVHCSTHMSAIAGSERWRPAIAMPTRPNTRASSIGWQRTRRTSTGSRKFVAGSSFRWPGTGPEPNPVPNPGPAVGFPFGDFGTDSPPCPPLALRARPRRPPATGSAAVNPAAQPATNLREAVLEAGARENPAGTRRHDTAANLSCQRDQEPPPWTANPHARCRFTWTAG